MTSNRSTLSEDFKQLERAVWRLKMQLLLEWTRLLRKFRRRS